MSAPQSCEEKEMHRYEVRFDVAANTVAGRALRFSPPLRSCADGSKERMSSLELVPPAPAARPGRVAAAASRAGLAPKHRWPRRLGPPGIPSPAILRGGFRSHRLIGRQVFDDDLLAVVVAVVPRVQDPAMQRAVAHDHDLLRAGPMARPHLVGNGRLRLRGLNASLRRCGGGRRRGGILGKGRGAKAESGDGGERQHKLIHDVLLGG